MNDKTIRLIAGHEGFNAIPYRCTAQHWTVGFGYNLDANPLNLPKDKIKEIHKLGIGKSEATELLVLMVVKIEHELSNHLIWWSKLNAARQSVLLDMAYNLGIDGLLAFKKTLSDIEKGDYESAAWEMLRSQWATQVKSRAKHLSIVMSTGVLL